MRARAWATVCLLSLLPTTVWAQSRDVKVREDRKKLAGNEDWIYNDYGQAVKAAKAAKKPLLLVFR